MLKENLKTIYLKPSELTKLKKFLVGKTWGYGAELIGISRVTLYNAVKNERTGHETYLAIYNALISKV